jgi:hypothetical protein
VGSAEAILTLLEHGMMLPYTDGLIVTTHFDPECAAIADRHYSRRTVGARQFTYSGRKIVLRDAAGLVLFVWMFPDPQYRADGQVGYNCAIFRNESERRSSDIILEAEGFAVERWGPGRAYTFVDARKIRSTNPGCCFKKAGWKRIGTTKSGKDILEKWLLRTV